MPYCPYCGNKVDHSSKFCFKCGNALNSKTPSQSTRTIVYQGELRKCPSCGAEVPSFKANCPECGHEFVSSQVADTFQDFTDKLHWYDSQITSSRKEINGWSSWNGGIKTLWVFLNIYTFGIPELVSLMIPRKIQDGSYSQQKASFIDNYAFPNERGIILEVLIFIKAQLAALVNGMPKGDSVFWENVWTSKALELHEKAEIIMPDDPDARQTYDDITDLENKFKRKIFNRNLLFAILIIAIVVIVFLLYTIRGPKVA